MAVTLIPSVFALAEWSNPSGGKQWTRSAQRCSGNRNRSEAGRVTVAPPTSNSQEAPLTKRVSRSATQIWEKTDGLRCGVSTVHSRCQPPDLAKEETDGKGANMLTLDEGEHFDDAVGRAMGQFGHRVWRDDRGPDKGPPEPVKRLGQPGLGESLVRRRARDPLRSAVGTETEPDPRSVWQPVNPVPPIFRLVRARGRGRAGSRKGGGLTKGRGSEG